NDTLIVSVRNLGYTKNAGEFARRFFADIGSAGGHRAMAKAVVPMRAFREKFGDAPAEDIGKRLQELVAQFLHEAVPVEKRREPAGVQKCRPPLRPLTVLPSLLLSKRPVSGPSQEQPSASVRLKVSSARSTGPPTTP